MKKNDKVYFTFYGEARSGVVSSNPTSSVVWLIDNKTGKERWMHAESLSLTPPEGNV